MELGNDFSYPMKGFNCICFQIPLGDFLRLIDILFLHSLMKNRLSVSYRKDLCCVAKFNAQKVIIVVQTCVMARRVGVGGLCTLQADLVK